MLVVDDEAHIRSSLQKVLEREDYVVSTAATAEEALQLLENEIFHVVLTDQKLPGMNGLKLLHIIKERFPATEVILITGYGTVETAVEAMREGAYDFISKPFKRIMIVKVVAKALEKQLLSEENRFLRSQLLEPIQPDQIISESPAMKAIMKMVKRVAPLISTVLITGESGTGKEVIARAIHRLSPRRDKQFVAINCGAIPENLLESELFGHVRGSFTGAVRDKEGFFKVASGGTLFLDEIGNIPVNLQVKLLRAIEEKSIIPVGGTRPIQVDIRIIAATNMNLEKEVEAGRFREDLFYRLNVVGIELPPLRNRQEDILPLARFFIQRNNQILGKSVTGLSPDAEDVLLHYHWKGNIRELENVIERGMILCDGPLIKREDLPANMCSAVDPELTYDGELKEAVQRFERRFILRVLMKTKHDKRLAAQKLGLSLSSLYRKMNELGIEGKET
ncbi:MAG: sigma-54-dependent Fis family transcriptional regulator [Calditrichaeota bacterium]|nr:sigma-54-dependent Fis family transcriptional regulator [Calditrichota bacterium]